MTLQTLEAEIARKVAALGLPHRTAFAASCCERLLPTYDAFVRMEGWGQPGVLREVLGEVWRSLGGAPLSEARCRELVRACEGALPDLDEFSTIFASGASAASIAVACTLEHHLGGNIEDVTAVAHHAVHALEMYLYSVGDPYPGGRPPALTTSGSMAAGGSTTSRLDAVRSEQRAVDAWVQESPLVKAELAKQREDIEVIRNNPQLGAAFLDLLRTSSQQGGLQPFARGILKQPPT